MNQFKNGERSQRTDLNLYQIGMVLKSRLSIKIFNYFTDHPLKRRATRRARAGSVRRQSSKTKRQGSVRSGSHSIGPGTTPGGKYITYLKVRKSRKQFMGPQFF